MRAFFSTVLALALLSPAAFANSEQDFPSLYSNKPAKRYSGDTPIDLGNGLPGNNGTYGNPNPDYEAWAKAPAVVAGLSEQPYSYRQKSEFVNVLKEQLLWGETAMANWKTTSSITRPEVVEYSKQAIAKIEPVLKSFKSATDTASGANEKEWTNAESGARKALIDFRTAYTQMHHNTQWHSRHAEATK